MRALMALAERIPGIRQLYGRVRRLYADHKLRTSSAEDIFTEIYRDEWWDGEQSVSGTGSSLDQASVLIAELPGLLRELGVGSLLDIPCGDFHWMSQTDLSGVSYVGAEIVEELVERNRRTYERENVEFRKLNLIADPLPQADLVLCRDCLVHFSFADVFSSLGNICASGSSYLLTTTFPSRAENRDILTGRWRPLNLEVAPFSLPRPIRLVNEGCTERDGQYSDKSLGLWQIEEVRRSCAAWQETEMGGAGKAAR